MDYNQGEWARKLAKQSNDEAMVCVLALAPVIAYVGYLIYLGRI